MNNYHSKLKPFIAKCFEASTFHITQRDSVLIHATDQAYKEGTTLCTDLIVMNYEEGCFIFAAWDDNEVEEMYTTLKGQGFSNELIELLKLAKYHNCKFLQLDRDGVVYEELPVFDWDN